MDDNIIDLLQYRERKEEERKRALRYKELNQDLNHRRGAINALVELYSTKPKDIQLEKIKSLQCRHSYDLYFIHLLDLFMEKYYPDYQEKFSQFIDEMKEE